MRWGLGFWGLGLRGLGFKVQGFLLGPGIMWFRESLLPYGMYLNHPKPVCWSTSMKLLWKSVSHGQDIKKSENVEYVRFCSFSSLVCHFFAWVGRF